MSWSLGETAALALKAARGAGLSWGMAEEAAGAVFWLHQRGLPGISALCGYLDVCGHDRTGEDALCPLETGSALSDGTRPCPVNADDQLDLGLVKAPLLMLPFVATIPPGTVWLTAQGFGNDVPCSTDAPPDHWQSGWLRGTAFCQLTLGATVQIDQGRASQTRLPDQFACCVERLTGYAHRTYAPATSQSRLAGAGAGLTDND
jgi:hypothetical protein